MPLRLLDCKSQLSLNTWLLLHQYPLLHVGPIGNTQDVFVEYGETTLPLAFYSYIAGSFGANINSQLAELTRETGVDGSAMPVDILINFAQDYAERGWGHEFIKRLFSVNREVRLQDLEMDGEGR